jgi:hypothetical protein
VANTNPERPQKFKSSDILFYSFILVIFIVSFAVASYFTNTILHDPFLRNVTNVLDVIENLSGRFRLSPALRANLANAVVAVGETFLNFTAALAVPLIWYEAIKAIREFIKVCKRNIEIDL